MKKTLGLAAGALLAAVAVPSLAQAQNAYTTTTVNLRAGPGFEYPIVFAVPGNIALQSYGCLDGYSWCDISVNGYRGWMSGDYIGYVQEGRWVPVYDYGPRYNVPIISFTFGSYWDTHYRTRPWYSQRTRWERWDNDHRGVYAPLQRRAMPTALPRVEADRWKNNNGKFDNNRGNDNNRGDNGRNDNNNGRNTGDHNNDGHNDNGRGNIKTGDHNNDGHNDNGRGNQKTNVTPPNKAPVNKTVVAPTQPTKPVAPQDANRRGDKDGKGGKGKGGDNNDDKDRGSDNDNGGKR